MAFMKVLPGQEIGQTGADGPKTFRAGEVFEVPDHQVNEFRHRAVPSDEAGNVMEEQPSTFEGDLSRSMPHERVSLLEQERDRLQQQLDTINQRIESEKAGTPVEDIKPRTGGVGAAPANSLQTQPMPGTDPGAGGLQSKVVPTQPDAQQTQTPSGKKADVISQ